MTDRDALYERLQEQLRHLYGWMATIEGGRSLQEQIELRERERELKNALRKIEIERSYETQDSSHR